MHRSRPSAQRTAKQPRAARRSNTTSRPRSRRAVAPHASARRNMSIDLLGAIRGKSKFPSIPLDVVYPGTNLEGLSTAAPKLAQTKLSTLSNGIKVITGDATLPVSTISVSINVGSRYENPEEGEQGLTHLMERSLLRSTPNRLTSTLIRDLAKLGADITTAASREHLMLTATTNTRVNPTLGAVADILKNAMYNWRDLAPDVGMYGQDNTFRQKDANALIADTLHTAAFGNFGLGQSMYAPASTLKTVNSKIMRQWHEKFVVADRLTIAATGVEHESFVALAEEMLGGIAKNNGEIESNPTQYVANNIRIAAPGHEGSTNVAFAWNAPALTAPQIVAANVLQTAIGGGASFSSGGPGKGMYTRLYQNVLAQHHWVENVSSALDAYTDAGLLSIQGTVPADAVGSYADVVLGEVQKLQDLSDEEVSRAKNMYKTILLQHLEQNTQRTEEMARHTQLFGDYKMDEFITQLDALQTADVKAIAKAIFEQPMTVVTYGDASQLPREL